MLKKRLIRILAGAGVYIAAILIDIFAGINHWIVFGIFLAAFLIIGGDVIWKALRNIVRGRIFDENFLMLIATVGAFALQDYREGVAVMRFTGGRTVSVVCGESFQKIYFRIDGYCTGICKCHARRKTGNSRPGRSRSGRDYCRKAGRKNSIDGVVLEGTSF